VEAEVGGGVARRSMSAEGRVFLDTNVLVYLFDDDSPTKQQTAQEILTAAGQMGTLVLSTQVLQEFYVTATRKLARPLSEEAATEAVNELLKLPLVEIDAEIILLAIRLSRRHRISLWDALIIEAAARAGCERVLTEDLQHGWEVRNLRIENPFGS
jgi:predicted nucleic acid-binding protein